jgi:hypothetical protein
MTQFISRAYNTFEIDSKTRAIVIKSSPEVRLRDEAEYYKTLPPELAIYFPRVLFSTFENEVYKVGMEYYAYNNLGNQMITQAFSNDTWEQVFNFIFTFINNAKDYQLEKDTSDCRMMYIDKTEKEYNNLVENFTFFTELDKHDTVSLNSEKLKNFRVIWPAIKKCIEDTCLVSKLNYIHGDLCFSNILFGINPINNDVVLKFIDPRGSFGSVKSYGDPYYDLAKLMHSCDGGYEYFITDNFTVSNKDQNFTLSYSDDKKSYVKEVFDEVVKKYEFDARKIKILQGTIFIGMCARHYDSFERQKAMLLTGLRILNEVYETL